MTGSIQVCLTLVVTASKVQLYHCRVSGCVDGSCMAMTVSVRECQELRLELSVQVPVGAIPEFSVQC